MIKELPSSRPAPAGGPGISRRDIAWRQSTLRAAPRPLRLPGWADAVLLLAAVAYLLAGLASAPMTIEEGIQESLTTDAGTLFTHPGQLLPGGTTTPDERPPAKRVSVAARVAVPDGDAREAIRLAYGSLTRYVTAAGWYAGGGRASEVPDDLDRPAGYVAGAPQGGLKLAARTGPALVGVLGILVIYRLTRRLFGRGAAWLATLAYALHPTLLLVARRPVDANLSLTLGLSTVLVAAGLSRTLSRGEEPRLAAWTGLSLLAGLTLASGPDAVPYLGGALAFVGAGLAAWQRRLHREPAVTSAGFAVRDVGARRRNDPTDQRGISSGPLRDRDPWRPARHPSPAASRRTSGYSTGPLDLRAIAANADRPPASFGVTVGWLAVSAAGAVLLWVLVSPALWGWLPSQLVTRHADRVVLAESSVVPPPGPEGTTARLRSLGGLVTDPFLTPRSWKDVSFELVPAPAPGLSGYQDSGWAGLPLGTSRGLLPGPLNRLVGVLAGLALTVCVLAGVVLVRRLSRRVGVALSGWTAVTAVWLLAWPSVQPDHEAPLIALACLWAAAPVPVLTRMVVEWDRGRRTLAFVPVDGEF